MADLIPAPDRLLRIAAIRLLCPDPARTAGFYVAAFGAETTAQADGIALAIGRQRIELVPTSALPDVSATSTSTAFQHCALIVSDMAAAMARLAGVPGWRPISRAGPETLPATSGGVTAFKFRDPDSHPLEFLAFRPDNVPAVWRDRRGLVLGIDHTAITVADTAASITFYAGLGFTVGTSGVNRGVEQARMDDVDDPVVEVTGLMPPGGAPPHLELLCYRRPGTQPHPLAADDVLATRTVLAGDMTAPTEWTDPDGHRLIGPPLSAGR